MRTPTFFILAALLDGPRHGYAIIRAAAELSENRVKLTAGTLYGALDRLAADRLVEEAGREVVNGRLRQYYRITDAGAAALQEEAAGMASAAELVRSRLPPRLEPGSR